jgi:hypothetical protein
MRIVNSLLAAALLTSLCACATRSTLYPEFKQPPTVSVSKDTVSTMTETAAEDYLIPGSQVFVAGKGGASRYFALVGVAIDKSRNESAVSGAEEALRLTFDAQLSQAIQRATEDRARGSRPVTLTASGGDITLLPAARLVLRDDDRGELAFRVTARFKDLASGNEGRKNYWYSYGARPLAGENGWAANQASSFKQASDEAMARLANIILDDLYGAYRQGMDPGQQKIVRWKPLKGEQVITGVLLKEEPDLLVIMPMFREKPMTGVIGAIPKELIRLQP